LRDRIKAKPIPRSTGHPKTGPPRQAFPRAAPQQAQALGALWCAAAWSTAVNTPRARRKQKEGHCDPIFLFFFFFK